MLYYHESIYGKCHWPRSDFIMHARFYHPAEIVIGKSVELSSDNKHHAMRVLRLKQGDSITLFNGHGGEYSAHIETINRTTTTAVIEDYHNNERESPLSIELVQAICVNEKMDWIIQKAVELGVTSIQPVSTARSIVHLSDERAAKRLQHWQKVVISSCEQCGRNLVPQVLPLSSLPHWLSQKKTHSTHEIRLLLTTSATTRLRDISKPAGNTGTSLLVGPEGGFTSEEEAAILHSGFVPIRLGKRTLRTESVALATISALQTLWGDF